MKRFYLFSLLVTTLILGSCKSDDNDYIAVDDDDPIVLPLIFENLLSEMSVFTGPLASLTPAEGLHLFDLNTGLFTDYARKQRLLRLPEGAAMQYNNSDLLPTFPDNTLISKTFYYYIDDRDPSLGKKIIETRIIIKVEGEWKLGNYIWNDYNDNKIKELNEFELKPSFHTGDTTYLRTLNPTNEYQKTFKVQFNQSLSISPSYLVY